MLKLILTDGTEEKHEFPDGAKARFEERKEGIRFYDPTLQLERIVTWDKIKSFSYERTVSDYDQRYAAAHMELHSDENQKVGMNTTTSVGTAG